MQFSFSRVEQAENCLFKYKMRYIDRILALMPDTYQNPDYSNALILGTAVHTGLEKGVEAAIEQYYNAYPIITDAHVTEAMKLETLISKAILLIPQGGEFEICVSNGDFIGYIDLLVPTGKPNEFDLYDFKYSNNTDKYKKSAQLHIYKYFYEQINPEWRIRNLYYFIVPKVKIKQGKKEELRAYRDRVQEELEKLEPYIILIKYDYSKVIEFVFGIKNVLELTEFPKNANYLCNWCEYQNYCEEGIDFMLLPKNERRNIESVNKKTIWLYGAPFSGKTTFANSFNDVLMLNTDGNIKFVDAPFIPIKDEVKVEGRITKKTLAWKVFKDAVEELEKKQNDFKTIIVDLLEDLYQACRLYMYDQMGITHESDDSFRAWDKVRTEFLSTLKRLMDLDYENIILISHVDTSKDITKKGGDKITAITPNLQEKVANKVAGMVDIVARVIADGDVHTLSFKTNEVIFGGGRLKTSVSEIPLDYEEFLKVYTDAKTATPNKPTSKPAESRSRTKVKEPAPSEQPPQSEAQTAKVKEDEQVKEAEPTEQVNTDAKPEAVTETKTDGEKAPVRTRKRRTNDE